MEMYLVSRHEQQVQAAQGEGIAAFGEGEIVLKKDSFVLEKI